MSAAIYRALFLLVFLLAACSSEKTTDPVSEQPTAIESPTASELAEETPTSLVPAKESPTATQKKEVAVSEKSPQALFEEIQVRLSVEHSHHLQKCMLERGFSEEPQQVSGNQSEFEAYWQALSGGERAVPEEIAKAVAEGKYDQEYGCQHLADMWHKITIYEEMSAIEEPAYLDDEDLKDDPVLLQVEQDWLMCIKEGGYPEVETFEQGNSYYYELADKNDTIEEVGEGEQLPSVIQNPAQTAYLEVRDQCDAVAFPRYEARIIELHKQKMEEAKDD